MRSRRFTATSSLVTEQPVNSRKHQRNAHLSITTNQLAPTNYCNSYNNSQSHSSNQRPSHVSNSPSQNSPCQDMLPNSSITNIPENSVTSSRSHSFCRVCIDTSNNIIEYHRVHGSIGSSGGSSLLVSPEHPWSSVGNAVAAAEMLGSRQPGKNPTKL